MHWAHDAPETLEFVTGRFFYANLDQLGQMVLDKLAEFERQRNKAQHELKMMKMSPLPPKE